jgi:glycosyltransferase involved in cell wall biosynthesis
MATTKPVVMHVMGQFNHGGTEIGIRTLVDKGFYTGTDLHIVSLVRGENFLVDDFKAAIGDDRVRYLLPRKTMSARAIPLVAYKLAQEFKRLKPDVAILSLPFSVVSGRLAAVFSPKMKVITFEHNATKMTAVQKLALQITSLRSDAVYADNPETAKNAQQYYRNTPPTYEVPLSIVTPIETPVLSAPTRFDIFSIGRLHPQKNFSELIRAVGMLTREGRDVALTVAGEGELRQPLQRLVTELGLVDRVRLPGFIDDCTALREKAHIYVQPSLYEGQCLATVEAMAAGMVVVATDFGGVRDYGIDRKNMLKIQGFTAADIATTLRETMDNYATIAQPMARAAQATAQQKFGATSVMKKWQLAAAELTLRQSVAPFERPDAELLAHRHATLRK